MITILAQVKIIHAAPRIQAFQEYIPNTFSKVKLNDMQDFKNLLI